LLEQALADFGRVLGETHPHTLIARSNLAALYREAGRLEEALPLYERVLGEAEQNLGCGHPTTDVARKGLAAANREAEVQGKGPTPG